MRTPSRPVRSGGAARGGRRGAHHLALSFLGLGLRPPAISWGVLLQESQNLRSVALAPWLLLPGLFVIITVLALNFFGDGLRDASDPYR